jgi:ribosomal protein L11 methyltransferase
VVTLDPGLSFGTGQHATTHFCLAQVVKANLKDRRGAKEKRSLMDMGCGSGILAIAAAKLGYGPVVAFDFDPVAVRVAQKNCRTNRVAKKVAVSRKDLTKIALNSREKFEVVCANLMAPLLIAERDRILNRLAPGGTLILAGILASEFEAVKARYEEAGLELFADKVEREWRSGAFRRGEQHRGH